MILNSPHVTDQNSRRITAASIYKTKVNDFDELKQCLINVLGGLGQSVIDNSISGANVTLRMFASKETFLETHIYSCFIANFANISELISLADQYLFSIFISVNEQATRPPSPSSG